MYTKTKRINKNKNYSPTLANIAINDSTAFLGSPTDHSQYCLQHRERKTHKYRPGISDYYHAICVLIGTQSQYKAHTKYQNAQLC